MSPPLTEVMQKLGHLTAELAQVDLAEVGGEVAGQVLAELETVEARLAAVRARAVATVEAQGTWALGGTASLTSWLRERTGRSPRETARMTRQARALRDHLPHTRAALAQGAIGCDHVWSLVRHATASPACVAALADPHVGEEFLLGQAGVLDAARFDTLVRTWALRADPGAADRRWKDDSDREEVTLARTTDGWHGTVWLTPANGALVHQALRAQAGRRAQGDTRTPAQRRADALIELAGTALDSGRLQPGARIRPHLAITSTLDTLLALARAQAPATGSGGDQTPSNTTTGGADNSSPPGGTVLAPATTRTLLAPATSRRTGHPDRSTGEEPVARITTTLDHNQLTGTAPATLEDGTPIPFGLFAQLACESRLHRVIFGPDSEILDVGREERLFTAGQTRGIIARDTHCQFPTCDAPPGQGEIHHSLWWYAHHGPTTTTNGILLCRYHHSYVHQRQLSIERYADHWRFVRPDGTTHATTPTTTPLQPVPS